MIDVPASEYDEVVRYCEVQKKERKTTGFVIENPFSDVFEWCANYPILAVDTPLSTTPHNALLYDSPTHSLKVYFLDRWINLTRAQEEKTPSEKS